MSESLANSKDRSAAFDRLLEALIGGGDEAAVRDAKPWIADARPEDLVGAVDAAIAKGVDTAALKPAVSRLVNLLSAPLSARLAEPPAGDRLFTSLYAENAGLLAALDRGKAFAKALNARPGGDRARYGAAPGEREHAGDGARGEVEISPAAVRASRLEAAAGLGRLIDELAAIEVHYRKLENVVFPWFEAAYPAYRCVRLMWDIHDDARRGLKECAGLVEGIIREGRDEFDPAPLNKALGRLYFDLGAMAFREDKALFPVMMGLIERDTADGLFEETAEFGFAFIDEGAVAEFAAPRGGSAGFERGQSSRSASAEGSGEPWGDARGQSSSQSAHGDSRGRAGDRWGQSSSGYSGPTGTIPNEILAAIFSAMPVDMTWVDADDKVRWFSDSPHRIFPRSKVIIGRDVRNCHPGSSVGRVMAIVEAFKAGLREREAFWIASGGRFIHIEYFALRDVGGAYLGTLEVSQDITGLRALEGEKRLAD